MKVLQLREFFLFFSLSFIPCVCTVLDTLGRARNVLRLGALSVPSRIGGERLLRTFLNIAPLACRCVIFLLSEFFCQAGYVNGNPSGSRSEIRSKKSFVEDWVFVSVDSSDGQTVMDFPVLHSTDHSDCIPETPQGFERIRFSSLGLVVRLPVMRIRVLTMTLNLLLVFVWAQSMLVHMCS